MEHKNDTNSVMTKNSNNSPIYQCRVPVGKAFGYKDTTKFAYLQKYSQKICKITKIVVSLHHENDKDYSMAMDTDPVFC